MSSESSHSLVTANLLALGAVALWASLAALGLTLRHVPAFLLTGLGLLAGSIIALPMARFRLSRLAVPWRTLLLGVFGLFGFHFLLFTALRLAPPVEANLVNYLWPLGIVVLGPWFLPGVRLKALHVWAALAGLLGAAIAILGRGEGGYAFARVDGAAALGFACALGSALIWASYSLMTKRLTVTGHGFPTTAIGTFALVSGVLAIICHVVLEPAATLTARDLALIAVLGLGPLGGAFFLWDAALKRGDTRQIGVISYLTPLLSTVVLLLVTGQVPGWSIIVATVLILGAAVVSIRA